MELMHSTLTTPKKAQSRVWPRLQVRHQASKLRQLSEVYAPRITCRTPSRRRATPFSPQRVPTDVVSRVPAATPRPIQTDCRSKQLTATQLQYSVTKAASDLLELQRDLATYEHNLFQATPLRSLLTALDETALAVQHCSESLTHCRNTETAWAQHIAQSLSSLTEAKQRPSEPTATEYYALWPRPSVVQKVVLYQGAANISGQGCMVRITAQEDSVFVSAHAHTAFRGSLVLPQEDLSPQELLRRLYFTRSDKGTLRLKSSPDHGRTFISIEACIKGVGPVSVELAESRRGEVLVRAAAKSVILPQYTLDLQQSKLSQLRRLVSKHLCLHPQSGKLKWAANGAASLYLAKAEQQRPFLDSEYVQQLLVAEEYTLTGTATLQVNQRLFTFTHFENSRSGLLKISVDDTEVEINSQARAYKLFFGLQAFQIGQQQVTLSRSLEVEHLLEQLFPLSSKIVTFSK